MPNIIIDSEAGDINIPNGLQDVVTNDNVLTQDNITDGGGFAFGLQNFSTFSIGLVGGTVVQTNPLSTQINVDGAGPLLTATDTDTHLWTAGFLNVIDANSASTILYGAGEPAITADATTTTISNLVLMPNIIPSDFADDAAAAIGNVGIGQVYHTAGVLKIRLV